MLEPRQSSSSQDTSWCVILWLNMQKATCKWWSKCKKYCVCKQYYFLFILTLLSLATLTWEVWYMSQMLPKDTWNDDDSCTRSVSDSRFQSLIVFAWQALLSCYSPSQFEWQHCMEWCRPRIAKDYYTLPEKGKSRQEHNLDYSGNEYLVSGRVLAIKGRSCRDSKRLSLDIKCKDSVLTFHRQWDDPWLRISRVLKFSRLLIPQMDFVQ